MSHQNDQCDYCDRSICECTRCPDHGTNLDAFNICRGCEEEVDDLVKDRAPRPALKVTGSMRVNTYEVFTRAVEEGIACGWRRAHKHVDDPTPESIRSSIETAVANAVCEVFSFDGDNGG